MPTGPSTRTSAAAASVAADRRSGEKWEGSGSTGVGPAPGGSDRALGGRSVPSLVRNDARRSLLTGWAIRPVSGRAGWPFVAVVSQRRTRVLPSQLINVTCSPITGGRIDDNVSRGNPSRTPPQDATSSSPCRARALAGATCQGSTGQPPDDQLDRDRPVLPLDPARAAPGADPCAAVRGAVLARRRRR